MNHPESDYEMMHRQQQEQMLKLVTKGFYNELINYGVQRPDILTIASHLLDYVMQQEAGPDQSSLYYNRYFNVGSVRDGWVTGKHVAVDGVSLWPLPASLLKLVKDWLLPPAIQASFVTPFPTSLSGLREYFNNPSRYYFGIHYRNEPVGIIGAENIDAASGRLEMRKLVGRGDLRGKGIGKRATFAFLYYAFMILNYEKVYIHSTDVNIRNLNLNSHFGFVLEGVFMQEIRGADVRQDVVRMGLLRSRWLEIFSSERP